MGLQDFDITNNTGSEIDRVVEHIRIELSALDWMSNPYGRAFSFMDETTKRRQPMAYEGLGKDYVNLTPDNDKKGMCWFMVGDGNSESEQGIITHTVGLVISANLSLIDSDRLNTELFTQELVKDVRAVLKTRCLGKGYFLRLKDETREFKRVFRELLPFEDKDDTHFSETRNVHLAPMQQFRFNFYITYHEESCGVTLPPINPPAQGCFPMTLPYSENTNDGGTQYTIDESDTDFPVTTITIQRDEVEYKVIKAGLGEDYIENVPSAACADATANIFLSDGETLLRALTIASGATGNTTIALATVNVKQSGGGRIVGGTVTVEAEASEDYIVDDSDISINGTFFQAVEATDSLNIEVVDIADGTTAVGTILGGKVQVDMSCANATAIIYLSDGATILDTLIIASGANDSRTIAVAQVAVKKSGGTLIANQTVEAEASEEYLVPDSEITINSIPFADVEATDRLEIEVVDDADGTTQVGSLNNNSGKWEVTVGSAPSTDVRYADVHADTTLSTTANYDSGWLLANGYLDRTHPVTTLVQSLDYSLGSGIATTLLYDNIHGTTDRFTLDDGTIPTNNSYTPHDTIHQDHLYGIEFLYRDDSTYTWANALHDPTTDLGSGLGTGWFLLPINVFVDSGQLINNHPLYPIGVRPNQIYWSSSFVPNSTSNALVFENVKADGFEIRKTVKTALRRRLLMRFMSTHP